MLMYVKLSKDNKREAHLCYEDYRWVLKVYNEGKVFKIERFSDEETAQYAYKNEDIGETY